MTEKQIMQMLENIDNLTEEQINEFWGEKRLKKALSYLGQKSQKLLNKAEQWRAEGDDLRVAAAEKEIDKLNSFKGASCNHR